MKNKTLHITVLLMIIAINSSVAFPFLKASNCNNATIHFDTKISLSDKFQSSTTRSYTEVFDSYKESNTANYSLHNSWCGTHKAGVILMVSGAGLFGAGILIATTGPSPTGEEFFSSQQLAGFMIVSLGVSAVLVGTPLLIAGSIHDHRKFSLIAPKKNEIGIAYNFNP